MSAWGAFVVRCLPLIRAEARRLVRDGAPLDVDDAVQDVAVQLLTDCGDSTADNVRARIRSRLANLARDAQRQKRRSASAPVRLDEIDTPHVDGADTDGGPHKMGTTIDEALVAGWSEDEMAEQLDAAKLLDLWPKAKGSRQAQKQMRDRWLPLFKEYANRGAA